MERRPRVLFVDDDADLRYALAEALSESGFDAVCAPDGPSGIDLFLEKGADLIVLDLGLPGMDGVAVCRALKNLAAEAFLPVVFLTGTSDTPTKVNALGEGDDFCTKPVSIDELVARMRVLLRVRDRELQILNESGKFRRYALADPLTELGNRRAFEAALDKAWARMERSKKPLALLMADIDRFKALNDRYGHPVGDRVLRGVGLAIEEAVREGDEAFRYGGEEFAIILPETPAEGAIIVAERIRERIAAERIGALSVTASLGVALAPNPGISGRDALVETSDRALYQAKAAGRDRVVTCRLGVATSP